MLRRLPNPGFFSIAFAAVSILLLCGCASTPKVDWDSRIGAYTFDDAVLELGPPDRSTLLSEGSRVAEWVTTRRTGLTFGLGTGISRGGLGVGVGQTVSPGAGVRVLRLVFDEEGKLKSWNRL